MKLRVIIVKQCAGRNTTKFVKDLLLNWVMSLFDEDGDPNDRFVLTGFVLFCVILSIPFMLITYH